MAEKERALAAVYDELIGSEAFDGSHVSLDRDTRGEEYLSVAPDWIDANGLRLATDLAAEYELALALTKDGLRFDLHTGATVRGVEDVKRVLAGEDENEPDA